MKITNSSLVAASVILCGIAVHAAYGQQSPASPTDARLGREETSSRIAGRALNLGQVLDGVKQADRFPDSGRCSYTIEETFRSPRSAEFVTRLLSCTLTWRGSRFLWWVSTQSASDPGTALNMGTLFDGETTTRYFPREKKADCAKGLNERPISVPDSFGWRNTSALLTNVQQGTIRLLPASDQTPASVYVLDYVPDARTTWKISIDVEKDFRPVRRECYTGGNLTEVIAISYSKAKMASWFPAEATYEWLTDDEKGNRIVGSRKVLKIQKWEADSDIPDSEFQLELPLGTSFSDMDKEVSWRIGDSAEEKERKIAERQRRDKFIAGLIGNPAPELDVHAMDPG